MDNALMIGVKTQQLLRRRMDVVANNLANMNTTGFKTESVLTQELSERPARATDRPQNVRFADEYALQRDMRTGRLEPTGNVLDLALEDPASFFSVRFGDDTAYTRDGTFALDELARLVTREGQLVLDNAGGEIVFDPEGADPTISPNGVIRQGDLEIATLGIVRFDMPEALEKAGDNLWTFDGENPAASETPGLRQGFLEASNVTAILELTNMIQISKAYEHASRIVKNADDLRERTIERLGRAS